MEVLFVCPTCQLQIGLGIDLEPTAHVEELVRAFENRIGTGRVMVCPRCDELLHFHVPGAAPVDAERLARFQLAKKMDGRIRGVRFAVGAPSGAQSAIWRLWLNNRRDDIYLSARSLAGDLKISLHPDYWYFGFTKRHVEKGSNVFPPGADRKVRTWTPPPEFAPGWTRALVIDVPGSEVVPQSPYTGEPVIWLPCPSDDEYVEFSVLISKPGASRGWRGFPGRDDDSHNVELVARLDLAKGEKVWILAHTVPMTDGQKQHTEEIRSRFLEASRDVLLETARRRPNFAPRILAFTEAEDGARGFVDISIAAAVRAME